MTTSPAPDLAAAAAAVQVAGSVVDGAVRRLADTGDIDVEQVVAYDVAHAAAAVRTAEAVLDYGARGAEEARIACAFVADALAELAARVVGREQAWATATDWL
ncbi:MAG: acyl-CoA dehydrogenase family protein, partial [Acidimicrobiales bacterium]